MVKRKEISFYTGLIENGEYLLLKSEDSFYKSHYSSSPMCKFTGFSGTAGEAVIDKNGNITLFVDTRYHVLAKNLAYSDIDIYNMDLGESFFEAFEKSLGKNRTLWVNSDISYNKYLKLSEIFKLKTYKENDTQNLDIDETKEIFEVNFDRDFKEKIKKIKQENIERMLVFDLDIISYLTGFRSFQAKYSSNFKSIMYLDFREDKYVLFLDKIPNIKNKDFEFVKIEKFFDFISKIKDVIYLNYEDVTYDILSAIKNPKNIKDDKMREIVSIKSKEALFEMKKSFQKLDIALYNFREKIKEGMSEFELKNLFEEELKAKGALGTSFQTMAALDENSKSIHYSTYDKNKLLKKESLLLLDCGGYWDNGFATDITRVFYFGENPPKIYKKIYTLVLKAFISCFLSKETNAQKLDNLAREILKDCNGFSFGHGLGHGIGVSCHQNPPKLSMLSNDTIKPYQTHSIEPGLYGGCRRIDFGIRIENCVYFDGNYERFSLSKYPFEEILIDYDELNAKERDFIKQWNSRK